MPSNNTRFALGDIVLSNSTDASYGMIGRVVAFNGASIGVEFEKPVMGREGIIGHNLFGEAKSGHGWWVAKIDLELIGDVGNRSPESLEFSFLFGDGDGGDCHE